MLTLTRDTKRLTIIVIYIFLFGAIGTGLYFLLRSDPTCFDGKQNQSETGVDCGGVCTLACMETVTGEPMVIREVTALAVGEGQYDIVARVFNPNGTFGAESFTYTAKLIDAAGNSVGTYSGTSWILPQETKTLLAFGVETSVKPSRATLEITQVNWKRLNNYDGRPKLEVYNKRYESSVAPGELGGVALGLVTNESGYDYRLITIKVVLRDERGEPIAINQTDRRTFLVGEQHEFRLTWPNRFGGTVDTVDVEIDADVYRSENFLRRYLPTGRSGQLLPN